MGDGFRGLGFLLRVVGFCFAFFFFFLPCGLFFMLSV